MSNPWFRMYHEFATDPKVQMLSEADQRRFIMLLCLRCSNGDETLQDEEIAFQLRIGNDEWQRTKTLLQSKNLIDEHGSPVAWDKRQYASDSSTARVRKYRNRKKLERNVSVTPPDTESDTDTEDKPDGLSLVPAPPERGKRKPAEYSPEFEAAWQAYPAREGSHSKKSAWSSWRARLREGVTAAAMAAGVLRYSRYCAARGMVGGRFVMQAERFFGVRREFESDWRVEHEDGQRSAGAPAGGAANPGAVSTVGANSAAAQRIRQGILDRAGCPPAGDADPVGTHG